MQFCTNRVVTPDWLVKFVEHRVGDKRIVRLIRKWLKAGILEDGTITVSDRGTGQGSVISPLLANIYLHYVLDLWAERWRRHEATGDMIIVRYADDLVVGFEREADANRFLEAMRTRFEEFALSLHPDKTCLIEFGRLAAARRRQRGLGKPETFTFLGFTFICGKSRSGKFLLKRKSRSDRVQAKLTEVKEELRRRRHQPIPEQGKWLAHGVLQLSCGADKLRGTPCIPRPCPGSLATLAQAAKSEGQHDTRADEETGRRLASTTAYPSSVATRPFRRQTPEVGAVCGNPARTVLCAGGTQ